eukprot:15472413-Alexandrium_andersonii.AAC.1
MLGGIRFAWLCARRCGGWQRGLVGWQSGRASFRSARKSGTCLLTFPCAQRVRNPVLSLDLPRTALSGVMASVNPTTGPSHLTPDYVLQLKALTDRGATPG